MLRNPATADPASHTRQLPAALHASAQAAITPAAEYLKSRQSPSGGFCFYRWQGIEEPSLADTWHAVAALSLLGLDVPQAERIAAFARGFGDGGLDNLYYRTLILVRLNLPVTSEARARIAELDAAGYLQSENVPFDARLKRARQIVNLQRHIASVRDPDAICQRILDLQEGGGWGEKPNLFDTWLALAILDACGKHEPPHTTRRFINTLQVTPFGFTATPDSNYADLGIVHAGLRACELLKLPVRYPHAAASFLLACQCGNGGFARRPDALPNIALTHRGLLALTAAGLLPARHATEAISGFGW